LLAGIADVIEYQVKQRVYVWSQAGKGSAWLSIGPDDLQGYRQFRVKIMPLLPTDTYAKSSQAINELGAGIIDKRTARENIGYEQPDEIEQRIWVDKIKELPQVQTWLMTQALEKAGLELGPSPEEMQAALPMMPAAAQAAMGGAPPGAMPGAPGAMPGAMPGPGQPGLGAQPPPMQGQTPPGTPMMPGEAGPGGGGGMEQIIMAIIQALQQGVTPEEIVQALVQQGLTPEQATQLVQLAIQTLQQQAGAGGPGGQVPASPGYAPANAVMAAPGVMAAPPPPPAGTSERPRPRQVGPTGTPGGSATGRAPGTKRGSQER